MKLRRLYNADRTDFILMAEPLPAAVSARMTDAEHIAHREAERAAIAAETSLSTEPEVRMT